MARWKRRMERTKRMSRRGRRRKENWEDKIKRGKGK